MLEPSPNEWIALIDIPNERFKYGAEFLYHGIEDMSTRSLSSGDGVWIQPSCLECPPFSPLGIKRIGPLNPTFCKPSKIVVSEALKSKIGTHRDIIFEQVLFTKIVRMKWNPGDDIPDLEGVYPEEHIFSGVHDPELAKTMEKRYELVIPSYDYYLAHSSNQDRKTIKVQRHSQLVTMPWVDEYFAEKEICSLIPYTLIRNRLFEIIKPFIDPDWFQWKSFILKDLVFQFHD